MDTVKVNGVTLTREQIETALKELNAEPSFQAGDIVKWDAGNGKTYLVVSGPLNDIIHKHYAYFPAEASVNVRFTNGSSTWTTSPARLTKVSSLA